MFQWHFIGWCGNFACDIKVAGYVAFIDFWILSEFRMAHIKELMGNESGREVLSLDHGNVLRNFLNDIRLTMRRYVIALLDGKLLTVGVVFRD